MNLKNKIKIILFGLFFTVFAFGQTVKPIEYFGLPEQLSFNDNSYNLVWSSNPTNNYYKQEYLAKGDTLDKFKQLIIFDIITGNIKIEDVVGSKIAELQKMKVLNPLVNYEAFEKDGEIMLDFLVSANTPDGKHLSIVERNVYRYKSVIDKNGQKGVLLFGVSERAYEDDIDLFFRNLKPHRFDLINLVGAFEIPEITIAK